MQQFLNSTFYFILWSWIGMFLIGTVYADPDSWFIPILGMWTITNLILGFIWACRTYIEECK